MQQALTCIDCGMQFQAQPALNKHRAKFCINSHYASLDSLNQQFEKVSKGKDISIHGRPKIVQEGLSWDIQNSTVVYNSQLDEQYKDLIRQIDQQQDNRLKLQRQKVKAQDQLMHLEQKQQKLVIQSKRQDLQNILKRRQQLANQQQQLQKQIKAFQRQRKQQSRVQEHQPNQDFMYREGRQAGKIAMQRQMLEEKKREIERGIRIKQKEEEKISLELNRVKDLPMYIPDFRKTEPKAEKPVIVSPPITRKAPSDKIKQSSASASQKTKLSIVAQAIIDDRQLKPQNFAGKQRTLFQSLNTKNKSDEDIFIQSLVAQQYDALNILARLPKDSQLYHLKMKQYLQMSKLRQQAKDALHATRLDKVRREFEAMKMNGDAEKNNLAWLDRNRKEKLVQKMQEIERHNKQLQMKEIMQQQEQQRANQDHVVIQSNSTIPYRGSTPQQQQLYPQPRISSKKNNPPYAQPNYPYYPTHNLPNSQHVLPGTRGYKISLRSLQNYPHKGPICLKFLLNEQNDSKPRWSFSSKYHDDYAASDQRDVFNPNTRNRRDNKGDIVFGQSFEVREDLQKLYNSNQQELFLWVMMMEKDQEKMSNQPQLSGWYCFKLTHFGQIREGVFTVGMYAKPSPFPSSVDMNRAKGKMQQQIVIELNQIILSNRPPQQPRKQSIPVPTPKATPPPQINNTTNNSIGRNSTSSNRAPKQKLRVSAKKSVDHLDSINQPFFISNQQQVQFQSVKSTDALTFTLGISALRTLPSHTGPVKLQISFMDASNQQVLEIQQTMVQLGRDMYNPMVQYSKNIKEERLPCSTVVVIRIMSLDTISYEPGLLGFAYFHLFFNTSGEAVQNQGSRLYLMLSGQFQLPIYWGNITNYLTQNQLKNNYPQLPCSSILVSISPQPITASAYSQGKYNTSFFTVTPLHYKLFQQQSKRQKLNSNDYLQSFLKVKGLKGYSQQDMLKYLRQSLAFNQQNCDNLHVFGSMAEYNPAFGVIVNVDVIRLPPTNANYYYFTSICLSPPANYYKDKQNDLHFQYLVDLASASQEILLKDDGIIFSAQSNINSALIVQLLRIKLDPNGSLESSIQSCGYGLVPLFDLQLNFLAVDVRIQSLRLQEGEFAKEDVKKIGKNVRGFLQDIQGKKKSEYELMMRVMNGYFPNQLQGPSKVSGKGKALRTIFQNSKGFKSSQDAVRRLIETTYGLKIS